MKKIIAVLLLLVSAFAYGKESGIPGMSVVDLLVCRPIGVGAMVVGSALYLVSVPLVMIDDWERPNTKFPIENEKLVTFPVDYTFQRPLGVFKKDADGYYRN